MRGETGGGRWKVKREEGENEGKRKAGGTREAKGGIWNKNQATLVQSFVVFIPDLLTLYILLTGSGGQNERWDCRYRHPCVPKRNVNATSMNQDKYENLWRWYRALGVSLRCDFSHSSLPSSCVFTCTPCWILWGRNNGLSSIPTLLLRAPVCLLHSFSHSSLSLSSLLEKKLLLLFFFFIQGGGSWACVSKIWVKSVPFDTASPLLFPLCFTWLVKQQSFKKGRRKRRCILSLPLAVSQYAPAVSCGLFLMTGKKKKKKKRRAGCLPRRPLAHRLSY